MVSVYYYGTRQWIASAAWIANDFAFYGNKLQQGLFLSILYPAVRSYTTTAFFMTTCRPKDNSPAS